MARRRPTGPRSRSPLASRTPATPTARRVLRSPGLRRPESACQPRHRGLQPRNRQNEPNSRPVCPVLPVVPPHGVRPSDASRGPPGRDGTPHRSSSGRPDPRWPGHCGPARPRRRRSARVAPPHLFASSPARALVGLHFPESFWLRAEFFRVNLTKVPHPKNGRRAASSVQRDGERRCKWWRLHAAAMDNRQRTSG